MAAVSYARAKEIFLAVCSLPAAERESVLALKCAGDASLRSEVESLLVHHHDQSILATAQTARTELRIVELAFGQATTQKWDEEQRQLLHRRVRMWVLNLHMLMAVFGVRAFSYVGSWSLLERNAKLSMLTAMAGMSGLSGWLLTLKLPSMARLRRIELALTLCAATVIASWGYGWLSHGAAVVVPPALNPLYEPLERHYWVTVSGRTCFHFSAAMLSFPLGNFWALLGCSYALIVPSSPRRIVCVLLLLLAVAIANLAVGAWVNRDLRAHTAANIVSFLFVIAICYVSCAYIGCKFQGMRWEIFTAKQVGQYQLTKLLGRGAMGEVYLAQHKLLRRPCAVKLIRPEQAGSEQALVRFEREVQAMAQLTHPNTVEVYDFGRTGDGTFFYAMEYLPGTTLEALVERHGPLPPGRVVYLLSQVCGALAEAHNKGLVHRDIKPGNIFVCERGGLQDVVKILDYGLVHVQCQRQESEVRADAAQAMAGTALSDAPLGEARNLTQPGQVLGTPAYMSPEQVEGQLPDVRSDLYSVGGVACFLLTGRPPYEQGSLAELFAAHRLAPIPRLRERLATIPAELEAVIMHCLAKDPAARYRSAEALGAALGALAAAGEWDAGKAKAWWQSQG